MIITTIPLTKKRDLSEKKESLLRDLKKLEKDARNSILDKKEYREKWSDLKLKLIRLDSERSC